MSLFNGFSAPQQKQQGVLVQFYGGLMLCQRKLWFFIIIQSEFLAIKALDVRGHSFDLVYHQPRSQEWN